MTFSIRADIIPLLKTEFGFTDTQIGQAVGPSQWAFAITIFCGAFLLDHLGMGRMLWLAFIGHVAGTIMIIYTRNISTLFWGCLVTGLANGIVECVINPLTATLYPQRKTYFLNLLHSWWPGGLVIGGVMAFALTKIMNLTDPNTPVAVLSHAWKIKMAFILIPTAIYGVLMIGQKFPQTERVASGLTYGQMFAELRRPLFWFLTFLMMFTAATELGPDQWMANIMEKLLNMKREGILFLIYTSGLMFMFRGFLSGPLLKLVSPIGLLIFASIFSAIGLFSLSHVQTALWAFAAATIFGMGKSYFWPTMMGFTAERFPRGGALVLGIIGAFGVFSVGYIALPAMGKLQDHYAVQKLQATAPALFARVATEGNKGIDEKKVLSLPQIERTQVEAAQNYSAVMTFRWVSLIPACLAICFIALSLGFKARGGYQAVSIEQQAQAPTVEL